MDPTPQFRIRPWHAVAVLVGMLAWIVLILAIASVFRAVRGGA